MSPNKRGTVPIESVVEDLFVRTAINNEHVLHLAMLYDSGTELPPITVTREGNRVIDGRHRLAALKYLDKAAANVEWVEETDTGRILVQALQANVGGALPPTNADIVYAIQQMLEAGMVGSAIGKQFAGMWPPSLVRRYVTDAQSALAKARLIKAKMAVVDEGMTVGEAALKYKIPVDTLKANIAGKKKRRTGLGEFKASLTTIFKSRGSKVGHVIKNVQQQLEDGDVSWATVEQVLDHLDSCCKATSQSARDWRRRLEAQHGKTAKKAS